MRISDWSSDVCSSDLNLTLLKSCDVAGVFWGAFVVREPERNRANIARLFQLWEHGKIKPRVTETFSLADGGKAIAKLGDRKRSEERRVGKECVSTCRSRWSQYH